MSNRTAVFEFHEMVLGESLFASRLTPHCFVTLCKEVIIFFGSHYFLVNNDWESCFSLAYYDWGSLFFVAVNIHRYTGLDEVSVI